MAFAYKVYLTPTENCKWGWGLPLKKGDNLSPFSGHHATSRSMALLHGVGEKTVRLARERCHSHTGGCAVVMRWCIQIV